MTTDHSQTLRIRLKALTGFLASFETPGFSFGAWRSHPQSDPGVTVMPLYALSDPAADFARAAYDAGWVLAHFDWSAWAKSDEARRLRDDPKALQRATVEQLARLLTTIIRQDRFCEGALAGAFDSGLIVGILRRAAALELELTEREI